MGALCTKNQNPEIEDKEGTSYKDVYKGVRAREVTFQPRARDKTTNMFDEMDFDESDILYRL